MDSVKANNLGFPRIGPHRELKKALEGYWSGRNARAELDEVASGLRRANWALQQSSGIDLVPCNDFSLYDHVLDTAVMVGAVPCRYRGSDGTAGLGSYFAMARGGDLGGAALGALEMTKWFDTNYHYIVPELAAGQRFEANPAKALGELAEAKAAGVYEAKPVLVGPLTFLLLAKGYGGQPLALLAELLGAYEVVLAALASAGAGWAQLDEPVLGLDLDDEIAEALPNAYARLAAAAPGLNLMVATYFTGLRHNLAPALALPVAALHIDIVSEPAQLGPALEGAPESLALSLGAVDGRNIWKSDLNAVLGDLERAKSKLGAGRLMVAPSCSLMHLPVDLGLEDGLQPDVTRWLAFATQRLAEVRVLTTALNEGRSAVSAALAANAADCRERASSPLARRPEVRRRSADVVPDMERRSQPYQERRRQQAEHLGLPLLPTTTIGSFPQTAEVRGARARYRRGDLDASAYESAMRAYIADVIAKQQDIGLDVLVHGEPERNDMVEYFGENLDGYTVTGNGWVQSYGSRCVKPPVLFGDISRPEPVTVRWALYAQSLSDKPVKGMLTGPVTMLQWSFVRNDQPRSETCKQLALAIRDEVTDLEAAGIGVIQVDEPALREGLPLHTEDRPGYLRWAVSAFRLATSGASPKAQVHTHMCYVELDDIIDAIIDLDADVISLEAARSGMGLRDVLDKAGYANDIGPGVWDIHSPRVPSAGEMEHLLAQLAEVIPAVRLWVNPDCGLKTRAWAEVEPALANMVEAARRQRAALTAKR